MTNPDNYDTFQALVGGMDFRGVPPQKLAPFNEFKNKLLLRLGNYLQTFVGIDTTDEELYASACCMLTEWINRDALQIEGLDIGDEVVSNGELVHLLADKDADTVDINVLDAHVSVIGSVAGFAVTTTPDQTVIADSSEYVEDMKNVPVVRFGLVMLLTGAVLKHPNGELEPTPPNCYICVPMDVVDLPMERVVK